MASLQRQPMSIANMQAETRRKQRFAETESALQVAPPRKGLTLASSIPGLLSRLGPLNPMTTPIRPNDIIWLFDNTAYVPQPGAGGTAAISQALPGSLPSPLAKLSRAVGRMVGPKLETTMGSWGYFSPADGQWAAEFSFAVFENELKCSIVDVVGDIARKVGLADDPQDMAAIQERLTPFLLDVRPARMLTIEHGGRKLKLGPTGSSGIATNARPVAADKDDDGRVKGDGIVPPGVQGIISMHTYFSGPEGWGVISDIDDTIKITQTSDPVGILRMTFIEPATAVAGMPELYQALHSRLRAAHPDPAEHVPFFYLSASPYNLYPMLRSFRDSAGFPPGELMLRDSSWKTIAGLLSALTLGTEAYKVGQMRRVRAWFPRRKMIFIGDSTQSDPEAYGHIAREYPGWVKLILIRRVTDIAAVGIESKNMTERFEKAFEGVSREVWHVFEDPAHCVAKIDAAIARG